jgi:ATP-binding cassette, subfamily B, multidrug efflux pump
MKKPALQPLKKYAFKVVAAPLLKLIEAAIELATPFLIRYIIDDGLTNGDWPYVLKLGGIMLGLAFFGFLVTMVAQYLAARVSSDYGYDLKKTLYAKVGSLSEKQLSSFGKGKILTLINNDSFSMQNGVMMFMRLLLRGPFLLLGSLILSFIISPVAGFIFLGVLLGSALVIGVVMALSPKKYAAIQSNLDNLTVLSGEGIKGARPIRAFEKERYEEQRFAASANSYKKKSMSMAFWNSFINPLTFCFINIGIALVVYYGGLAVSDGSLTSGEIVSLISYLTSSLAALIMFSRLIVSLNRAMASEKRLNAFLSLSPAIVDGQAEVDLSAPEILRFDDVSLSYGSKDDKPAVSHLSFALRKGQTLGLIGGTGSGKSSTLALITRLYDPSAGTVYFGGQDLRNLRLSSLRKEIAIVSQKPALFKGTIRSNLLLGKPQATDEELIAALKDSLAYEYVSRYSDGLSHEVEEGGANLSGGQKQRLLIARALLQGGSLLILDDSTSALDYLSDKQVRANLAKRVGLTKILVSQRATTLVDCDLILVYDSGAIVASGKHEDLLKSCPLYHEIYEMQVASR